MTSFHHFNGLDTFGPGPLPDPVLTQVDNACGQLEKLMEPMDEVRNEHKRIQLRELAALNGTLKDEVVSLQFCNNG